VEIHAAINFRFMGGSRESLPSSAQIGLAARLEGASLGNIAPMCAIDKAIEASYKMDRLYRANQLIRFLWVAPANGRRTNQEG
jgi:hypothetical protein